MINHFIVIDKIGFRKWALVEIWTDSTGALSRSKNYLGTYKSYEIAHKQLKIFGDALQQSEVEK